MSLAEIVNVVITQEAAAIEQAGFNVALILGTNGNFANRTEEFEAVDATLAAALNGGTASAEYAAATDLKAQSPCPVKFKVGQIGIAKVLTDDAGTFTAGSISLKVNGTTVTTSFTTDKDTTMAALATAIEALTDISTAVYSAGSHTITITPVSTSYAGITDIDLTGITGTMAAIAVTTTGSAVETVTSALNGILLQDTDWYGLITTSRTQADQELAAAWVESNNRIYFAASNDEDIPGTTDAADSTTLPAVLKAANYARTAVIYTENSDTEYPDAALFGKLLPLVAGSFTAKFKTLSSITSDELTVTQSGNVRDKNANTYEPIGGKSIFAEGTTAAGEFIDIIMFIDWLKARITEEVYAVLIANAKVPYSPTGLVQISSAIEKVLRIGQANDGITTYIQDSDGDQAGGFLVTLPTYADIPAADKSNRQLNNVRFQAWLSGAIHAVTINGVVLY
jgi:hypothetical protein